MMSLEVEVPVRFSEVDSLHIVWHGHYVRYFEDAREAFGRTYDLHYLDVYRKGFITPIVKLVCDYKKPLMYGDTAIVRITYIDTEAAKIMFRYEILKKGSSDVIATGETIQVFLDNEKNLLLTVPEFFEEWKVKQGLKK